MAVNPQKHTRQDFAPRLALFYAALFLTVGAQLPLLPVWLAAKGLDPGKIGIVLAVPMVVRVFAMPTAALLADRRDALRAGLVIAACASLAGFSALALADGLIGIITAFALASVAYTPLMLLADAYALRGLAQVGRAYGPVRLWGSAAFIVATFVAGYLLDAVEPPNLIWFVVAAVGITAVASWLLAPLQASARRPATVIPSATWLLRTPAFLAFAGAASLIQASHAIYYGFSTIHWQAGGLDGMTIGVLWAIGVLAEIALFGLSARLPAAITPAIMLSIGAAGAVIRWSAMALEPSVAVLPVVQCLHGLSFGATHLGTLAFITRVAPAGLATTVQGYISVAIGAVMTGAMGFSGVLYGHFGGLAYGAMAITAFAGGLLALAAHRNFETIIDRADTSKPAHDRRETSFAD
jgi:MFS transporter, PPP family, 3-phenylpropionic acid transporter